MNMNTNVVALLSIFVCVGLHMRVAQSCILVWL